MSVVNGIIKQHEGYISVNSEPGKGTTYIIYLPIVNALVQQMRASKTSDERGGSETIHVTEDEKAVRVLTTKVLTKAGYRVVEASHGEEAVRKFKEQKNAIQLLMLDVIMPQKKKKHMMR